MASLVSFPCFGNSWVSRWETCRHIYPLSSPNSETGMSTRGQLPPVLPWVWARRVRVAHRSTTTNSETGDGQHAVLPPYMGRLLLINVRKWRNGDVRKLSQQWNGNSRRGPPYGL